MIPNHCPEYILFRWITFRTVIWHISLDMENLSKVKQPLGQQNIADWIDSWVAQGSFNDYVSKICSIFVHLWPLNIVKIEFYVPPTLTKDFHPHKLKIRQTLLKFPTLESGINVAPWINIAPWKIWQKE